MFSCDPEELFKKKQAPQVGSIESDAEDFTVAPGDTVNFWVVANNPLEGELSYEWSVKDRNGNPAGIIIGSSHADNLKWISPIVGGKYDVQVKVSNADETITKTESITVLTLIEPIVDIVSPQQGNYIVQYQNLTVRTEIIHPLGIYQAKLIVNDTLLVEVISGNNSESYAFHWKVAAGAGIAEIKIVAEANITGAVGRDSINVTVEGVLPGKNNE